MVVRPELLEAPDIPLRFARTEPPPRKPATCPPTLPPAPPRAVAGVAAARVRPAP